jgi:transposase
MEGHLLMSEKERKRKGVFELVRAGHLTQMEASKRLSLSYRQTQRMYRRFLDKGDAGLVHRSRGRPSNRRKDSGFRVKVLRRYRERYKEFEAGPTWLSEKLRAEGLEIGPETLRRWLMEEGEWKGRRRGNSHRERRERREHFGELVQLDGSHHRWFGAEREQSCVMQLIDDASNERMVLFAEEETTEAAMRILMRWIERYGVPMALYTDRKTVYITDREPTMEEELAGEEPKTAFGKACDKLGIRIIAANSAQAKGRVERAHGVLQDRLVKELKLRGIKRLPAANRFVQAGFIDELNARFGVTPADPQDFHRPLPEGPKLEEVFCFEQTRMVQNDWTVRYENQHYQILKSNRPLPRPRDKVVMRRRLDGSLSMLHQGKPLEFRRLGKAALRRLAVNERLDSAKDRPIVRRKPARPGQSPWRQNCILMKAEKKK